jgi:flagellar motor switch/type III secretory pathway protein FliN
MQQLLEHQRDFDFIDENALSSVLQLDQGSLINLSGQSYHTVLIPSAIAISKKTMEILQTFAASGGKVVIMGRKPSMIIENTFLNAKEADNFDWAIFEPSGELTSQVLEALPPPDVKLDKYTPSVKYTHRQIADADLYFFFNESSDKQTINAEIEGEGKVQIWDAMTGEIEVLDGVKSNDGPVKLEMELGGYESVFFFVGDLPMGM